MFGKNPLEISKIIRGEEVCNALRLALIAEIDAIMLYSQLARAIENQVVSKVFREVAEEEKEHMGEFFYLLKKCDNTLEEMMEKGFKEVKELEEES